MKNVQTRARTTHADDHMETYTPHTLDSKIKEIGKRGTRKTQVKGYTGWGYRCNFPEDGEIILFLFLTEKKFNWERK